jgi:hypothetical protein
MKKIKSYKFDDFIIDLVKATNSNDKDIEGLHLLNPSQQDINNALARAVRDSYSNVVLHSNRTWKE